MAVKNHVKNNWILFQFCVVTWYYGAFAATVPASSSAPATSYVPPPLLSKGSCPANACFNCSNPCKAHNLAKKEQNGPPTNQKSRLYQTGFRSPQALKRQRKRERGCAAGADCEFCHSCPYSNDRAAWRAERKEILNAVVQDQQEDARREDEREVTYYAPTPDSVDGEVHLLPSWTRATPSAGHHQEEMLPAAALGVPLAHGLLAAPAAPGTTITSADEDVLEPTTTVYYAPTPSPGSVAGAWRSSRSRAQQEGLLIQPAGMWFGEQADESRMQRPAVDHDGDEVEGTESDQQNSDDDDASSSAIPFVPYFRYPQAPPPGAMNDVVLNGSTSVMSTPVGGRGRSGQGRFHPSSACSRASSAASSRTTANLFFPPTPDRFETGQNPREESRTTTGAAGPSNTQPERVRSVSPELPPSLSLGSLGHPATCQAPCKFFWKNRGCKEGTNCDFCHSCPHKNVKGGTAEAVRRKNFFAGGGLQQPQEHQARMQQETQPPARGPSTVPLSRPPGVFFAPAAPQEPAGMRHSTNTAPPPAELEVKPCPPTPNDFEDAPGFYKPLSEGTIGHPHTCQAACTRFWTTAGCPDGEKCRFCHACGVFGLRRAAMTGQESQGQLQGRRPPSKKQLRRALREEAQGQLKEEWSEIQQHLEETRAGAGVEHQSDTTSRYRWKNNAAPLAPVPEEGDLGGSFATIAALSIPTQARAGVVVPRRKNCAAAASAAASEQRAGDMNLRTTTQHEDAVLLLQQDEEDQKESDKGLEEPSCAQQ